MDLLRIQIPHEDPLVVSLTITECLVRRVLIDPGSSANVMPRVTFDRLEIEPEKLKPTGNPLLEFDGKRVEPIGMVELIVQAAERVLTESFVVVEIHPSYNLLMGRGWIHRIQGVPSTLHQVMRCLGPDGTKVIDIHRDQVAAKKCYSVTLKSAGKAEEVDRLLEAGFIREVQYPAWLSNVVVVQKKNGKWRVCIDFTNLNKACPKDNFPLPRIDQMVDATTEYERLTFLEAYSGYNQIPMDLVDEEKTSFVTERGTYCYKVMPFELKNAGATYQRLISKIFKGQMGSTVEAYIDDMVVKSKKKSDHLAHLQDVFGVLRQYGMKLNLAKCSFGVSSGQFLGHVVNHRGIEVSPAQAEALIRNAEPKTIKEVQALTGRIAALSRFISKLSDRCKPFFDIIRGHGRQTWGDEQWQALTSLKEYMRSPSVLFAPEPNEKLFLYLGVSSIATNAVLIRCKEGKQFPVFYVSKIMPEPERRYSRAEQMILSLVNAKRKLRHYFESHPIVVLTTFLLRMILHKPDLSGRMTKWAIELSSFDIAYEPRTAIKGQAVADFLLNCDAEDTVADFLLNWWKLFVDGSSNQMGAGIGIQLQTPEGTTLSQAIRLEFNATNNEAEYEALIAGMKLAKERKIKNLIAYSDSQLVIRQVNGDYRAKDKTMEAYRTAVLREAKAFDQIRFIQLPREYNEDADRLACSASSSGDTLARVIPVDILIQLSIFEELPNPSTQHVNVIPYEPSWIDPIMAYIHNGTLPERKDEARKIRSSVAKYAIVHDQLYRRSFSGPYLKCATPAEARQIMRTIHEGVCGNHSGGRSLAHKAMTQGYFWPNIARDAEKFSTRCDKCQRFGSLIHQPPKDLHVMATPWPFAQWGMDVVGPLPTARSQNKYVLLATDYFTKWVEAEPYPSVT
ncbi:uncharacterized protein LOC132266252 [Cornus florida]|uniref:uncharacterized protein LOC132266252 n=1 Tax=Cornus florida TaxID=4283 RepID=UPI0028987C7C|nr:uncharacterized protein LOC132266252 [Cornus florida]